MIIESDIKFMHMHMNNKIKLTSANTGLFGTEDWKFELIEPKNLNKSNPFNLQREISTNPGCVLCTRLN